MTIPYYHGESFSNPTTVRAWIDYPFRDQGDPATKVYHHIMRVFATDYTTLADDTVMTDAGAKPIRSPFPDDAGAYYVGDTPPSHIGDGMIEFDRQFANIPADRIETNGFYSFEFPVVPGGIFLEFSSSTYSWAYDTGTFQLTINAELTSGEAEQIRTGDYVTFYNLNRWEYMQGSITLYKSSFSGICTKSGNTIEIKITLSYSLAGVETAVTGFKDNSPSVYSVQKMMSVNRASPIQLNSPSIVTYRYIKTILPSSILLAPQFQLASAAGDWVDETSNTTTPLTTDDYVAASLSGEYAISAEPESPSRWKGNIYQVTQIKVRPL